MFDTNTQSTAPADRHLDGSKLHIGMVQALFNQEVTDVLARDCERELLRLGVSARHITHVRVPGALEVGLALQALAEQQTFDALIALGCVIRGETYHFELVANQSAAALTRVSLDYQVPVINAILTTENLPQAVARQHIKGREAAAAAVQMALLLEQLS